MEGERKREREKGNEKEFLKDLNRDLSMTKMKSMFAVGISMIGLFGFLNNMYVKKK